MRRIGAVTVVALVVMSGCGAEPREVGPPLEPGTSPSVGPGSGSPVLEDCDAVAEDIPSPSSDPQPDAKPDAPTAAMEAAVEALGDDLGLTAEPGGVHSVGISRDAEGLYLSVVATALRSDAPSLFQGFRVRYCRGGPFELL